MSDWDMGSGEIMANEQMGGPPPEQETDPQEKKYLEDMIINDFISKEMAFTSFMNDADNEIAYNKLSPNKKHDQDHKAFTYYNNLYVKEIANIDNAPNLTLENFILLHNPSMEFRNDLTDFSLGTKNTDASDWEEVYNNDLELHKKSAITGYKNTLMAMGEMPDSMPNV